MMSSEHCPFVNRSETACEKHLRLGDMAWAMDHCFAEYESCPTYAALSQGAPIMADSQTSELLQLTIGGVAVEPVATPVIVTPARRRPKTVISIPGQIGLKYRLKRVLLNLTIGQLPAAWRRAG